VKPAVSGSMPCAREDLDNTEFEVLARHTEGCIQWYCHACSDTPKLIRTIHNIQDKQSKLEIDLQRISCYSYGILIVG